MQETAQIRFTSVWRLNKMIQATSATPQRLIESLHNFLLTICDSSNSYKFVLDLVSDKNAGTEIVFPFYNYHKSIDGRIFLFNFTVSLAFPLNCPSKPYRNFSIMLNTCLQKFLRINFLRIYFLRIYYES